MSDDKLRLVVRAHAALSYLNVAVVRHDVPHRVAKCRHGVGIHSTNDTAQRHPANQRGRGSIISWSARAAVAFSHHVM
ncbi:MAG TPA: hypothetical protein VIJ86_08965 [Acidimicrobiales bacterium]